MNLDRCSFGTAFSLSYVTQYVRTTHYLTPNHPRGQFVLYVQNSCFLASLFSPWKYYVLYFAFELCQLIIYHPSLEEGGAGGNPGADLHPASFQHPYTRKSTTTPSGVNSMFAGLPHYISRRLGVRMPFCSTHSPPSAAFRFSTRSHPRTNFMGYISPHLVPYPGCFLKLSLPSTIPPDTHCASLL